MKNIEFMQLCLMAGFNIFRENWIIEYLINFNEETLKNNPKEKELKKLENDYLIRFDDIDQNTPEILNIQYINGHTYVVKNPYHGSDEINKKNKYELELDIHSLISYHFKNPLNLKQLARIKIRNCIKSKLKYNIENNLNLPIKLKNYLMLINE